MIAVLALVALLAVIGGGAAFLGWLEAQKEGE